MNQDLPIDHEVFNRTPTDPSDQDAASELLVELRTRIVTQSLYGRMGGEESVVHSTYMVFSRLREIVLKYPRARRFEMAALAILDHMIRPRVSRWHRWSEGDQRFDDGQRRTFRREFAKFQPALLRVASLLELIREGRDLQLDDLFMGISMTAHGPIPIRSGSF